MLTLGNIVAIGYAIAVNCLRLLSGSTVKEFAWEVHSIYLDSTSIHQRSIFMPRIYHLYVFTITLRSNQHPPQLFAIKRASTRLTKDY